LTYFKSFQQFSGASEGNNEERSHDSRPPGRDSNPGRSLYEAGLLLGLADI